MEFFDTEVRDFMALRFDNRDSLKHASGKMKFSINETVRPNQGVLELRIPGTSGWAQDAVNIDKFQELSGLDRENIVGVSLDLMPGNDFSTAGSWASLVLVLQSEANYWMPLTGIDLTALQPGKWKRVDVAVDKAELRPAMKAFFKIVTVVNSGGKVSGSLDLDDLAFSVRTTKANQ